MKNLPVWQNSRELAKDIDALVYSSGIKTNFKLKDQMLGSSGSIMDNIAEGFERGGNKEFVQFLFYAKGSAGELRSQLYRAADGNYISKEELETFYSRLIAISKELESFSGYLRNSGMQGYKFNQ